MADKKTGPVKPPILDMKARENPSGDTGEEKPAPEKPAPEAARPDTTTGQEKAGPAPDKGKEIPVGGKDGERPAAGATKPTPSAPTASGSSPGGTAKPNDSGAAAGGRTLPLAATAIAGGLIGLVLAFGLAYWGYWPATPAQVDEDATAALEARIAELENTMQAQAQSGGAVSERIEALEAGFEETAANIASLGEAAPQPASDELEQLAQTVSELSGRVDALGAPSPDAETGVDETALSQLESQIADIEAAMGRLEEVEAALTDAQDRLADLEERIADQADFDALSADRDRLAQLPSALAGLETAIGSGAPFANELAAVSALLPGFTPGDEGQAIAAQGAPTASALLAQFRELIPALIAARPQGQNADWFDTLLDQAAAALALRPTGADDSSPAGLIGRTETALEAGDLQAARDLIAAYPADMARIAQPVADGIRARLLARDLLTRAQAGESQGQQQEEDGQ